MHVRAYFMGRVFSTLDVQKLEEDNEGNYSGFYSRGS